MSRFKRRLPEGVQDFLPQECSIKRALEAKLTTVFESEGFDMVEPPSFAYYDTFSENMYIQESMIKFFDHKGRIMVLRPDLTVPIARMAATSMPEEKELRLCYIGNAFAQEPYNLGLRGEFTQAGVELIGRGSSGADAETAALAIRSLIETGLTDFKLDIGQVAYFKGMARDCGLDDDTIERIRSLIDSKNTVELDFALSKANISGEARKKLMALPDLFGGAEALTRAAELSSCTECDAALENLREVYELLCDFGYEKYVTLDLGMLHKFDYYTGMVFRGISHEFGFPLVSGGRYDNLYAEFGKGRPAVGFALGVKRVMIALEHQSGLAVNTPPVITIGYTRATAKKAAAYAAGLRKSGARAALYMTNDASELPSGSVFFGEDD